MERIKRLNNWQKGILLLMAAIMLVFVGIYMTTISRVGFEYQDKIFVRSKEEDSTVYSGKLQGEQAEFIVSEDQTVVFRCGDKVYGPYTKTEDADAIPKEDISEYMKENMTGVELREGEKLLFRGGVMKSDDFYWLYNEDGTLHDFLGVSYVGSDGIERDENGNVIDPIAPSVSVILELMDQPTLTHHGEWLAWFGALLVYICNAISILFADELFRFSLSFQIRNADRAEPSDWEIAGRYISWITVLILGGFILFVGLS